MCWCEQISPLAHSSRATWQPFNLSHCIEMHNTHLLGRTGQLSQAYFTHSAPILTPRDLPPTVNKQWPPWREYRILCQVTLASTPAEKRQLPRRTVYFLVQMQLTGRYDHRSESDFCISIVSKMSKSYLFEMRFANMSPRSSSNFGETRPHRAGRACVKPFLFPVKSRRKRSLADFNTESIVCCLAQRVIWQFCCIIIKI